MVQIHDAMVLLHINEYPRVPHGTDLHELEDGVVFLDQEVRGVAPVVKHHVGLPVFRLNHARCSRISQSMNQSSVKNIIQLE